MGSDTWGPLRPVRGWPGWRSKASEWPATAAVSEADLLEVAGGADALVRLRYPASVVYGGDEDATPLTDFAWAPPETVFILRRRDGDWLVNTEGYSYARYTLRVGPPRAAPAPAAVQAKAADMLLLLRAAPDPDPMRGDAGLRSEYEAWHRRVAVLLQRMEEGGD